MSSKIIKRSQNPRKAISFILVTVLLIGAMFVPIQSMASSGEQTSLSVLYRINDQKSDDIEINLPLGENGYVKLDKDSIPDDPKSSEDKQFLGWKNLNGQGKDRDLIWSKIDLTDNFVITEDQKFEAVYKDIVEDNSIDDNDNKAAIDQNNINSTGKQKKAKGGVKPQANNDPHLRLEIDGKTITSGSIDNIVDNWAMNSTKTLKIILKDIGTKNGLSDNTVSFELPEGMTFKKLPRNEWISNNR